MFSSAFKTGARSIGTSLLVLAVLTGVPSIAQTVDVPATDVPRADDLDQSIAAYRADLDRFERALERRNKKARRNELKASAKARQRALKGAPVIGTPAQNVVLRDLYETQLSQWVAATEPSTADASGVATDEQLLEAADALFALKADADQKAILSEGVFEATFVGQQNEQLGDGHNSTLRFQVDEIVKGTAEGGVVNIRIVSGVLPNGMTFKNTSEFVPQQGERVMLFTSRGIYGQQALLNGGEASTNTSYTAYASAPYRINQDEVLPTASGQPRENRSRAALKASIKAKK